MTDQPTTSPPFNSSWPLLNNTQVSVVSDSNTRQRQDTQFHKDAQSILQKTDTLKTIRQAKERVKDRDYSPHKDSSGRSYSIKTNQTKPPLLPITAQMGKPPHREHFQNKNQTRSETLTKEEEGESIQYNEETKRRGAWMDGWRDVR